MDMKSKSSNGDDTPKGNSTARTERTRRVVSTMQEYCSIVLSDIFKLETYEVKRMPGMKDKWLITVEGIHAEYGNAMVVFSFILKTEDIRKIADTRSVEHLIRTGK